MPKQSTIQRAAAGSGRTRATHTARSLKKGAIVDVLRGAHSDSSVAELPLRTIIDSYVQYYAFGHGHTARAKRLDLEKFFEFVSECSERSQSSKVQVRHWDQSATQKFVDELLRRGEAPASVARRLATLKHLGRTLAEKVPGFVNPAREVRPPKIEIGKPKALSGEQIKEIKRRAKELVADERNFRAVRDEMIVLMLLDTGLRADEIRLMRRGQLDEKLEWIESVRTKGRRFRNVYIPTSLRPRLNAYLAARATELKRFFPVLRKTVDEKLPLFVSCYGAAAADSGSFFLGAKTLWRAVHRCSAGLSLHPHLLRHTFAIGLLDYSGDIRLVSQALGHGDVKVTMRYTERRGEEVARALESMKKAERKSR